MDTFHYGQSMYLVSFLAFPLPMTLSTSLAVPISRHSHSSRHIPKPGTLKRAPNSSESSSRIPTFSPVHGVSTASKSSAIYTRPVDIAPAVSEHATEDQPTISPSHIPVMTKHTSASSHVHLVHNVSSKTAEYPATDVSSPSRDLPASRPQARVTKFGGTDTRTPETSSLATRSVKFISPVHQGVPSVQLHRNKSERGNEMNSNYAPPELLKVDKESKEDTAVTSAGPSPTREASVQGVHPECPSSVMSSPEKQTDHAGALGPISSTESLEVTGSETSLASRRSLPVTLGSNKSAFAHPAVHNLNQQQSILLSVSLPHLGEGATATKGRRWVYTYVHLVPWITRLLTKQKYNTDVVSY